MSAPLTEPREVESINGSAYWTTRGFWAIVDQALFALSNLLINVLLARWLSPREYGAFVTAYVVLLLVSVAHYGAAHRTDDGHRTQPICRATVQELLLVSPALSVGVRRRGGRNAAARRRSGPRLRRSLAGQHVRRTGVRGSVHLPESGSPDARATSNGNRPSPRSVVRCICSLRAPARSCCTARSAHVNGRAAPDGRCRDRRQPAVILKKLGYTWLPRPPAIDVRPLVREHWNFLRWSGGAGVLSFAQGVAFYLVLPVFSGLEASAALRAMINFVMPVLQSDSALAVLISPELARVRGRSTRPVADCPLVHAPVRARGRDLLGAGCRVPPRSRQVHVRRPIPCLRRSPARARSRAATREPREHAGGALTRSRARPPGVLVERRGSLHIARNRLRHDGDIRRIRRWWVRRSSPRSCGSQS